MPEKADRVLKYLKYAVLIFVVIGVWIFGLGEGIVWSPWTVFGAVASPWKGLPAWSVVLSLGGVMLVLTIIGSIFIERFFCKYLCPLGAIFSLISRFRIFKIKKPATSCGSCRGCTRNCPMALPLYRMDEVRDGECINCLRCSGACYRRNVKVDTIPALTGTVATAAIAGLTFMGNIVDLSATPQTAENSEPTAVVSTEAIGMFKDGTYTGEAQGYRGTTVVRVNVSAGNITDITVTASSDDSEYLNKASSQIIPAIISEQDVDVAAVSGATFSSRGIINAVTDALGDQITVDSTEAMTEAVTQVPTEAPTEAPTEPETDAPVYEEYEDSEEEYSSVQGNYTDGVYYGSGSGFRGTTDVEVTVENGEIVDITVTSYQDDDRFFNSAQNGVIAAILSQQSVDVSSVSGATFSSNSIKEAVANALGLSYTNTNSSMGGEHSHHGTH